MPNLNKVFLMGNLTREPVLKSLPSGNPVCEFGLAINRRYQNPDGTNREEVVFLEISAFNRQADPCNRYLHKGSLVTVEGHLRMDTWTDRTTNQKQSRLRINADRVLFMGPHGVTDTMDPYEGTSEAAAFALPRPAAASAGGAIPPPPAMVPPLRTASPAAMPAMAPAPAPAAPPPPPDSQPPPTTTTAEEANGLDSVPF